MSTRDEPTDIERFQRWTWVEVRYGDFDTQGHVNNAAYFTYMEQARVLFLYELRDRIVAGQSSPVDVSESPAEAGLHPPAAVPFVVANASCAYRRPIMRVAPVAIGIHCDPPNRASFVMYYVICDRPGGTLYASGSAAIVSIDLATGRPRALPPEARAALAAMSATHDEGDAST